MHDQFRPLISRPESLATTLATALAAALGGAPGGAVATTVEK